MNKQEKPATRGGSEKNWKDVLLKTGLPLEYAVSQILDKHKMFNAGEYAYTRSNEAGVLTEFSIDLRSEYWPSGNARDQWGRLTLLIECKYAHPGIQWIFLPTAEHSLVITGVTRVLDFLCTRTVDNTDDSVHKLDQKLPFCLKGIVAHDKDANSQVIARGLSQLRWGIPELLHQLVTEQTLASEEDELRIEFFCPILVTTAPLFVFKPNLTLRSFRNADDLLEVADHVDALICYQDAGPQLGERVKTEFDFCTSTTRIKSRMEDLWVRKYSASQRDYIDEEFDIRQTFGELTNNVLVVNIDHLDMILRELKRGVRNAKNGLRRFAKLIRSPEGVVLVKAARG